MTFEIMGQKENWLTFAKEGYGIELKGRGWGKSNAPNFLMDFCWCKFFYLIENSWVVLKLLGIIVEILIENHCDVEQNQTFFIK